MGLIEHYGPERLTAKACTACAQLLDVTVFSCPDHGTRTVDVEYVRADQPRGAVEALRAIADAPDSDAIKARIENHYSDLRILKECRNLAREALGEQ